MRTLVNKATISIIIIFSVRVKINDNVLQLVYNNTMDRKTAQRRVTRYIFLPHRPKRFFLLFRASAIVRKRLDV